MPPKKQSGGKTKASPAPKQEDAGDVISSAEQNENSATAGTKRKKIAAQDEPSKAPRRSGRGAPKAQASPRQLLVYLLSKDAEELCRPEDEASDIKSRGSIRTYSSSALSPFEELICAIVLSRPISHRLGLRSIRTIFNDPYKFTTPKAIKDAGSEKHHQALWDAKTQHKGKTAEELGLVADVVLDKFTSKGDEDGVKLEKVRDECRRDVEKERELLQSSIKGLGKTGLDIFLRRVQWLWDEAFPFVDDRTGQSLKALDLPSEGKDLVSLVGEHWKDLDTARLAGNDEAAKKRRAFVVILERAIGADLEKKTDALLQAAGSG